MMRKLVSLKIVAAVTAAALPVAAQATVTYQFAIAATEYVPAAGFSFTAASPITADTIVPAANLTSCITGYADTSCDAQELVIQSDSTRVGFATLQLFEGELWPVQSYYYFALDAFTTNGLHGDEWGEATLTVSGIPEDIGDAPIDPGAPGVPEPASWALMIGGLGLAGAALRRRTAAVRFAMA